MTDKKFSKSLDLIAYCGLNCGECSIYLAPSDSQIADKLVNLFQGRWENVKAEDFHCGTCRNSVERCWSEDCWIRDCCKEKRIEYCFECVEFPCSKLIDWANSDKGYEEALQNLKAMKKEKNK